MTAMTAKSAILTGVLFIAALGFVIWSVWHAGVSKAALATATERHATLRSELHRLPTKPAAARDHSTPAKSAVVASAPALPATAPRDRLAVLASEPELRELYVAPVRDPARFARRFAALNLTPTQQEKIIAHFVEQESARLDLAQVAESEGLAMDSPRMQELARAQQRAEATKLRDILGGREGLDAWNAHIGYRPLEELVDSLARKTYSTETPLTAQQGLRLRQILAAHTDKDSSRTPYRAAVDANRINWNAVFAQMLAEGFPPLHVTWFRINDDDARFTQRRDTMIEATLQRYPTATRADVDYPSVTLPRRKS